MSGKLLSDTMDLLATQKKPRQCQTNCIWRLVSHGGVHCCLATSQVIISCVGVGDHFRSVFGDKAGWAQAVS